MANININKVNVWKLWQQSKGKQEVYSWQEKIKPQNNQKNSPLSLQPGNFFTPHSVKYKNESALLLPLFPLWGKTSYRY